MLWTTGSKDIEAVMPKIIENYIMVHKFLVLDRKLQG